ncbi:MAG TPA: O-methyltransferase [Frankiaceae bacterium]|nr:O-methyltransferase [Frankiaceae bacterium]
MTSKSYFLDADLHGYLLAHSTPPDPLLADLAEQTRALGDVGRMQITPEQGTFLTLLTASLGARRAVEVGTFTGYSSVCIARGLAPDGHLLCCDVSEEWTSLARRYWARAGLADRVELRLGPAADTLASLPEEPVVDLAFLDANKPGYRAYYELLLPRLRPGGLLLADNVLQHGRVLDPDDHAESTEAIRAFNDRVAADDRVDVVVLPIADGLTLARKR